MEEKKYLRIVSHYESCLKKYGDTHLGVDWPNEEGADIRYKVMLDVIRARQGCKISLLDYGCGASGLYEYICERNIQDIEYSGLDISKKFIQLSKTKYPFISYYCLDILEESADISEFDYIVMNGVFTEKRELSFDEMFKYFMRVLKKIFCRTRLGLAFNIMSKHVDWEREDLFHLPYDTLANFLMKEVSRNFIIRNDYGLYEYTTYVYKDGV